MVNILLPPNPSILTKASLGPPNYSYYYIIRAWSVLVMTYLDGLFTAIKTLLKLIVINIFYQKIS